MNTNINTDNYEAYLLDYMEGNLSPDEAEQLKAFVAAQGLDWDELTEDLPHLEAPVIVHPDKESLKNRPLSLEPVEGSKGRSKRTIPLYVKIASAAAAAALLLTVTLWPEKQTPTIEPITDLSPLTTTEIKIDSIVESVMPEVIETTPKRTAIKKKAVAPERAPMPELPELKMIAATQIPVSVPVAEFKRPETLWATGLPNGEWADTQLANGMNEIERGPSLFSKGLLWLTDGHHDSFAGLFSTGLNTAKQEIRLAATDVALTAYYRADEHFEEVKENWQDKRENER